MLLPTMKARPADSSRSLREAQSFQSNTHCSRGFEIVGPDSTCDGRVYGLLQISNCSLKPNIYSVHVFSTLKKIALLQLFSFFRGDYMYFPGVLALIEGCRLLGRGHQRVWEVFIWLIQGRTRKRRCPKISKFMGRRSLIQEALEV